MEMKPINRNGCCPHCNMNWEGNDIYTTLSVLDIHLTSASPKDIAKIASEFGWTPDNNKCFSKVIVYEIIGDVKKTFFQCPKCLHAFNAETGEHFGSIYKARIGEIYDVKQ